MVSEWVIRNGLYWMSTIISWKLKEDEQNWLVSFETFNDEVKLEFEQILNDSRFREKLQVHTGEIRTLIIDNVLRSINLRLAQ
ncbi:His-Xaa-Ser system protein HxsD [Erwinia sp. DT-104]|uniref:His-Xaa-Ser system protein HxsD n=1 Tax=Erwinia sp. DT-104 TaxID=3396161 RepID=UPI003F1A580A